MNQMAKNLALGPILAPLAQILTLKVFPKIWLCQFVDIIISYHHVQYQKNLMIKYWENVGTDRRTRVIS